MGPKCELNDPIEKELHKRSRRGREMIQAAYITKRARRIQMSRLASMRTEFSLKWVVLLVNVAIGLMHRWA